MEAIASFARIAEEYKSLKKAAATPEARSRIDQLIKLNHETMGAVRRGLMITEEDIGRESRSAQGTESRKGERAGRTAGEA